MVKSHTKNCSLANFTLDIKEGWKVIFIKEKFIQYSTSSQIQFKHTCTKRGTKDTKGTVKLINLKQTDNAMAKNEKDKQKNNSTHDTT